jgi:predicted nucleic acid-binding protein
MTSFFVDANVFLRFLTHDDANQRKQAVALFRQAAKGEISLISGPPVLFEVAWVLRSAYDVPREKVLDALSAIVAFPGLMLLDADLVEQAIALARSAGQGFADAYIAISAQSAGADAVATFNRRHFEKMGARVHSL